MLVTELIFDPKKGYGFGQKTFYSEKHLGIDYVTNRTPYKFPVELLQATFTVGKQGGLTVTAVDALGYLHRFMHLSEFKTQDPFIKPNTVFGVSGSTGALSKGDHLHWDIRRPRVSRTNLAFVNFVDPDWWKATVLPKLLPTPVETEDGLAIWEKNVLQLAADTNVLANPDGRPLTKSQLALILELIRKAKNSKDFK